MSEEEIKTMVNNAFKKFSKELEENPDNVFNYLELQKRYNSVLKIKVKLQQENKKYKEVINKAIKYIEENKQHEYRNGNLDEYYLELNEKEMTELLDILKEVE